MKNLYNSLIAVAVAAMTITGCSKGPENLTPDRGGFTLNLIADGQIAGDTRTEYDPVLKNIKWTEGDVASFYVNTIFQEVTATLTDNIATFSLKGLTPGTLNIQGYYPMSAYWKEGGNKKTADKITAYAMTLPAAQTATTVTFDPAADILIARDMDNVAVTEATKELSVRFGRPVAISKFTYKITNSTLTASTEKVKSIALKVVSDGKYIAGNFYFNPTSGHFVEVDGKTEAMPELDAFADAKSNEVVVTLSDQPAVNANFDGWFVTSPVLIEVADQLVFTITTDAGTVITKTVTPSKELQFTNTKLNTLTVNIDNSVDISKQEPEIFMLVTGNGAFEDGGKYVFALKDGVSGKYSFIKNGANSDNLEIDALTVEADNSILNPDPVYIFTAAMGTKGFTLQNNEGKYIQNSGGSTTLSTNNTSTEWAPTFLSSGCYKLSEQVSKSNNRYISYGTNATSLKAYQNSNFVDQIAGKKALAQYSGAISVFKLYIAPSTDPGIKPILINDVPVIGQTASFTPETVNTSSKVSVESYDGTVVSNAEIDANGLITYTVSPNYTDQPRTGKIVLALADNKSITAEVTINQLASVFSVTKTEVILSSEAGATATITVTSDFNWSIDNTSLAGFTVSPESYTGNKTQVTITSTAENADEGGTKTLGTFKITRIDNTELSVTVKQESTTSNIAILPFTFSGADGKASIGTTPGMSQTGLGSDYATSHSPYLLKFDDTGDNIVVNFDSAASTVSFGVKMIGGTKSSNMSVEGSIDGTEYIEIEKITISGTANSIHTYTTSNAIDSSYRFIKLKFTKGSNIGVGNISINN